MWTEILGFLLERWIEILGFIIGLFYLWWEYHADSKLWLASIIMPTISMWIYFSKGLYADFGINIYYFVIAIYGWIVWTRSNRRQTVADSAIVADVKSGSPAKDMGGSEDTPLRISHLRGRYLAGATAAFIAIWGALYAILAYLTDSTVPVADSFTTALSIVASWMLARKYVEQWLAWIVVDAVCVGLYIYKGIYFYACLYAIYTVVAWFGYRKWLRLMHDHTS